MFTKLKDMIDGFRPCKRSLHAIEQNVEVTKELSSSISQLHQTLTGERYVHFRSTDQEGDDGWKNRRHII
jgi:hypothetical protein